jgi:hypothetical protein
MRKTTTDATSQADRARAMSMDLADKCYLLRIAVTSQLLTLSNFDRIGPA